MSCSFVSKEFILSVVIFRGAVPLGVISGESVSFVTFVVDLSKSFSGIKILSLINKKWKKVSIYDEEIQSITVGYFDIYKPSWFSLKSTSFEDVRNYSV